MSYVRFAVPRITAPLGGGRKASALVGGMRLLAIAVVGAILLHWDDAQATALQFRMEGTVQSLNTGRDGSTYFLGGYVSQGVVAGQAFSATISYEMSPPTGTRSYDSHSGNAYYYYTPRNGLQSAVHFDFGNGLYADGFIWQIDVQDGNPTAPPNVNNDDSLRLYLEIVSQNIFQAPASGPYTWSDQSGQVDLGDVDSHAFDGGSLPDTTPDDGAFEFMSASIFLYSEYNRRRPCNSPEGYCDDHAASWAALSLRPTSISAVVPLPGTAWLLGSAFSLLCAGRRRSKPSRL